MNRKMVTDKQKVNVNGTTYYVWANHYERLIFAENKETSEVRELGRTGTIFNETGKIAAIKRVFNIV